jgi:hypothetical protein
MEGRKWSEILSGMERDMERNGEGCGQDIMVRI